eukprot:scaffold254386_cov22-Tisochrysis_lutea.AAC.1
MRLCACVLSERELQGFQQIKCSVHILEVSSNEQGAPSWSICMSSRLAASRISSGLAGGPKGCSRLAFRQKAFRSCQKSSASGTHRTCSHGGPCLYTGVHFIGSKCL